MVAEPVHFRYAWARSPMGNLQARSHSDIPLATQRSDDWPMENIPLGIFGEPAPEQLSRPQRNQLMETLRQEDLKRRIQEAKELLSR